MVIEVSQPPLDGWMDGCMHGWNSFLNMTLSVFLSPWHLKEEDQELIIQPS